MWYMSLCETCLRVGQVTAVDVKLRNAINYFSERDWLSQFDEVYWGMIKQDFERWLLEHFEEMLSPELDFSEQLEDIISNFNSPNEILELMFEAFTGGRETK